jgi:diacylglycerol kinase family enzyme
VSGAPPRDPPRRLLLVVNPVARSVTPALLELIEKALAADFDCDVHETKARGHATELARLAVADGVGMVVVFSGDGTINEVANALVGTPVPLGLIPGGATNVLARGLGIPDDPIEATVELIHRALERPPRRISLGRVNGRHFTFACGAGLDAAAMEYLESRKKRLRTRRSYEWAALWAVIRKGIGSYAGREPDLTLRIGREELPAISVLIGNTHPYAYFKRWPVKVTPTVDPTGGLEVLSARKLTRRGVPRLAYQLFVTGRHVGSKHLDHRRDVRSLEVVGAAPFPVQVDGDFLGLEDRVEVVAVPDALWVHA